MIEPIELAFRRLIVDAHAIDRYRMRVEPNANYDDACGRIRADVRIALLCERVTDTWPSWASTTLHADPSPLRDGRIGVWTSDPPRRFYLLSRENRAVRVLSVHREVFA